MSATVIAQKLNEIAAEIKVLRMVLQEAVDSLRHTGCGGCQPPPKWIDPREI